MEGRFASPGEPAVSNTTEKLADVTVIRPFRVGTADGALEDLRRRIAATRVPSQELVADRSQGVDLARRALARELSTDWGGCGATLHRGTSSCDKPQEMTTSTNSKRIYCDFG